MDNQTAVAAFRYAVRHRAKLLLYLWDLPPWRLGRGQPDWVGAVGGRILRIPRLSGRYVERPGYYSRLRFIAHQADEVWVPSEATARDAQARFDLATRHVPYCFDSDRFVPGPRWTGTPPVLLSISRLVPHKNHAVLIEAASELPERVRVRIIGQGGEYQRLKNKASMAGVDLDLGGNLDDSALLDAYRHASITVCPSRFEGFGLTPLESIACGVPVVASDIPAHREFLGSAPLWFRLDDRRSLVDSIVAALQAPVPNRHAVDAWVIERAVERFQAGLARLLA